MFPVVCQGRSEKADICTETGSTVTGAPKPTLYMEGRRGSYLSLPPQHPAGLETENAL